MASPESFSISGELVAIFMDAGAVADLIDSERIERRLDDLMEIGRTDAGGVTRLAYTDVESETFEYVCSELADDFERWTDAIGNLYVSAAPDAPTTTYVGSHLDSVFNGGRLDGALGVVVAMEALEITAELDSPVDPPPTLAVFRGEESARFGVHTIGSRGALGLLTVDDFSRTDQNDVPLWLAMQRQGLQPSDLSEPTIDVTRVHRFFETHIEQGRVLDEADETLGVVTSVRAPVRYEVTVEGAPDHSGATPMDLRNDALVAVGEMITAVERVARGVDGAVATVGDVTAHDGAINKVCGRVTFPLDIRSEIVSARDAVEEEILQRIEEIADDRGVEASTEELDRSAPVALSDRAVEELDTAVRALEVPYRRLPSGGGHDAMNFQKSDVPTGMLFVPSVDGISHSPAEETNDESIAAAAAALIRAAH